MPDDYLRAIEALIAIILARVSSLDLGRLWQRRRPFFLALMTQAIRTALRKPGCRWQVESGGLIHCDCHGSLGATMGRRGTSEHTPAVTSVAAVAFTRRF